MANTGFGLRPIRYKNGAPWSGQHQWYWCGALDTAAIYLGDPVKAGFSTGTTDTKVGGATSGVAAPQGYPTVTVAAAGDTCRGVAIGFSLLPPGEAAAKALAAGTTDPHLTLYRPASTAMWVAVVDDSNVIFEVMEDGIGSSIYELDIGKNANFIYAAGSATTGRSKVLLDSSTAVTTSAQLRILRLSSSFAREAAVPLTTSLSAMYHGTPFALTTNAAGNANVFEVYWNTHEFSAGNTTGTGT